MIPALPLARMRILIVDDEPANVALLQYMLTAAGYETLRSTHDPRQVVPLYEEFQPDLILLDLMMPHLSGFEVMAQLETYIAPDDCLPILVLTADVTPATKHNALQAGASDFLTKPFDQIEVLLRIRHLLQIRTQHLQLADQNTTLEDAVRERTGELRHTLGQLEETVRQLRDTQQQVIQHERMSALGSMAAGLAHDFNNALSLILGYSELMMSDLAGTPYGARSDEFLGTVITAAQDAAKMFNRLRGFYRAADYEQEFRLMDINELAAQAVALTRPRWHGQALGQGVTIDVRCELASGLPPLLADAAELREMLTNLIFNAVDAMPQGGLITLRTGYEGPEQAMAAERAAAVQRVAGNGKPDAQPADGSAFSLGGVVLEVIDQGMGMDEETCRRCLEPFFTTKGRQGTGLGLAMVYGTMQRHGGSIDLQSTPGVGTAFVLRLPLRTAPDPLAAAPLTPEGQVPRRILAVDDQEVFLNILRHYLTGDCHRVETAADGREALEKFRARVGTAEAFDLVITDKAMPHMSGEALAAEVKALAPQTRVVLLTGLSMSVQAGGGEAAGADIDLTLLKPVTLAALRGAVNRVMTGYHPPVEPAGEREGGKGLLRIKLGVTIPAKRNGASGGPIRRSGRPPKT